MLALSVHHAGRSGPYSMPLLGSSCIEAEVWEDVCRPRERFVSVVVSEDRQQDAAVTQHADPNKDVCYSCPVLYDDKVSWGCTLIRLPSSMRLFITGSVVRSASSDLCQELKKRIEYNY